MVSSFVDILPLFMTAKYIHDSNVIISDTYVLKLEASLKVN